MEREQVWIFPAAVIAATYAAATFIIKVMTGYPGAPNGLTSLQVALFIVVVTAFFRFMRYFWTLWREGEDHPSARMISDLAPALLGFLPIVAGVAILSLFLFSITLSKSMIPAVVPFWADDVFAATDQAIGLRSQALAGVLSPLLPGIGLFYGLWHGAHLGGILWVLHWQTPSKARHILNFMLTWSMGMLLAFVFSSMGPIFTGLFDPSAAPSSVQKAVAFLLANYRGDQGMIGGGISAFPSMHVAIAAWLAIVLSDRGWTKLGVAYFSAIFASSIILGWHYAADGVAGAAIAVFADRIARAWLNGKVSETFAPHPVRVSA